MIRDTQFSSCTVNMPTGKCFRNLSEEQKDYLSNNSVDINYKKGEVITKRGSYASHVMFLVSGLAKVYIEDGVNTLVLKIVCPETLFGLTALSDANNVFQYSSMAYIDSKIRQIEINAFKEVLMKNSAFAKEVIDTLGASNTQINGRFFCLTHKQSYGRLADILICLSSRVFKSFEFYLPLNRVELAELSGMSKETVIRMLKKFEDDGLIELKGKSVLIKDLARLTKISEAG
jgi:CRP/FNR family transcriptional regulator, polysaccharide utilization system transcription regulator